MTRADARVSELVEIGRDWIARDPDPVTRQQLTDVLDRGDADELESLLGRHLRFGTAGLRAPMGPGPDRMNRLVVRRTAAGIARHLVVTHRGRTPLVVVGHDARHGSTQFAADVVDVLTSLGVAVERFGGPVPTPLLAVAVRHRGADSGVMITASHNPAADNGMKLYGGDGAQISSPTDRLIVEQIEAAWTGGAESVPTTHDPVAAGPIDLPDVSPAPVVTLGAGVSDPEVRAYLEEAAALIAEWETGGRSGVPRPVRVACTALHGVGAELLEHALRTIVGAELSTVADQRDPDPDFPTVAIPNPEEPGVLDQLVELAEQTDADVALAVDPDADRLAVALPDPASATGWTTLTGDQTGALLADHLLSRTEGVADRLISTTVVSSSLVAKMCTAAGVHHAETLTGFKWLARPAIEHPDWYQLMAYEEALGYAVGPNARDKDGIIAALVVVQLVGSLADRGRTAWHVLADLDLRHGAHRTRNGSIRLDTPTRPDSPAASVSDHIDSLAADPPLALGGSTITRIDRPANDVVRFWLGDGTRVIIRPSGTEPKIKYYCEAVEPVATTPSATTPSVARAIADARRTADARLDAAVTDLIDLIT